jgi:hypothetical protein
VSSPAGTTYARLDLAAVIDAWDRLPEPVKSGIVAMVKAASRLRGD